MSPFCPGLTLADCSSQQAFALRDEINARLAEGAWGTPIVVALFGAIALALFVRRSVNSSSLDEEQHVRSPELDRLLDEQLRALD